MKKVVVIVCLVLVASTYSVAKRIMNKEASLSFYQKDEKAKIKKEELPEAARKSLDGDSFKGWTVANVYKLANGEFEVELKKGDASKTVKFDKDGKAK